MCFTIAKDQINQLSKYATVGTGELGNMSGGARLLNMDACIVIDFAVEAEKVHNETDASVWACDICL